MNILLTSVCNRACRFCFAASTMAQRSSPPQPRYISEADFATALAFARTSGLRGIGLLGGEPSLHPRFLDLLEQSLQAGLDVTVFTNALWPADVLERAMKRLDRESPHPTYMVNVHHPADAASSGWAAQQQFFERLGRHTALSYTVTGTDDITFLVRTIDRYGLKRHVRLGVALPGADGPGKCLGLEDYRSLAGPIVRLADACDRRDIVLSFDCGFTLCMFETADIGKLYLAGARFSAERCGPVLDVGTDLSVWACFPLATIAPRVSLSQCIDCRFLRRGQCSGGCASLVYRAFNPC